MHNCCPAAILDLAASIRLYHCKLTVCSQHVHTSITLVNTLLVINNNISGLITSERM